MIRKGIKKCPLCNGDLKHYDKVKRLIKKEYGIKQYIVINRVKCSNCKKIHRELPRFIAPYKQYASNIILDVLQGTITNELLKYEDFPDEMTMQRWMQFYLQDVNTQKIQVLL